MLIKYKYTYNFNSSLNRYISFEVSRKWNSVTINNLSIFDSESDLARFLVQFHSFLKSSPFKFAVMIRIKILGSERSISKILIVDSNTRLEDKTNYFWAARHILYSHYKLEDINYFSFFLSPSTKFNPQFFI